MARVPGTGIVMARPEARPVALGESRGVLGDRVERLGRWARPRRSFALVFGGVVWTVWLVSVLGGRGPLDLFGNVKGADFIEFYTAGKILREGDSGRLYDFDVQERMEHDLTAPARWSGLHSYIYPPFFAFLFVPLALLPYGAAYLAWTATGLGLLVVALRAVTGSRWRAYLPWAFAFVPVFAAVSYGQNSLVSLFLLAMTCTLLRAGRDGAAGLVLGLLCYKPQLVAFPALFLLLERRWRVLAGVACSVAVLVASAWLLVPDALTAYVDLARRLPAITASRDPMWKSHSWFGFFALLLPGQPRLAPALAALAALATLVAIRRSQPAFAAETVPRWCVGVLFATVLASPHLMLYDLSLLVIAGMLLPAEMLSSPRAIGAVAVVFLAAALSQPLALVLRQTVGASVQLSVPMLSVAGLFLLRDGGWRAEGT